MDPTQSRRLIKLKTPLGTDKLLFVQMFGSESLCRPSEFRIEALAKEHIDPNSVLGERATVTLAKPQGGERHFDGIVTEVRLIPTDVINYIKYELVAKSWIWLLTRTSDCKIFQNQNAPDIIKDVFRSNGFSDFEDRLTDSYREREYTVQYRETDFNFVHRLMENEGIYYYVKHSDGKHTIILCDSYSSHDPVDGDVNIPYYPEGNIERREAETIYQWIHNKTLQPVTYVLNDYDYLKPKKDLEATTNIPRGHGYAEYEKYDYPGLYEENSDGTSYSRKRIEGMQAQHSTRSAHCTVTYISLGGLFTLREFPDGAENREYLITRVTYQLENDEFETGTGGTGMVFNASFDALESDQQFRLPEVTPKPFVAGPQTAVVVGPQGEEIYVDEHGRIKVQFHWDRYGTNDENSSCWIRVAQTWAGKKWGTVIHPRLGHEVVVDFLEGDPDRPLITGSVYNGDNRPPYDLPANKTQSGTKSRSSKNGSASNYNEIRIEDKKGEEEIHIHAERNLRTTVENDETRTVWGERTTQIKKNDEETILEGDMIITLEQGSRSVTLNMGDDALTLDKGSRTVETTLGDITTNVPVGTFKVKAMNIELVGTKKIKLTCGGSKIEMNPAMITIQAPMVKIN